MQLPRVVIATVFFVIGALIAVPALLKTGSSESRASTRATSSPLPSSPSPSESPSGSKKSKKSPSPSPSPSPGKSGGKTPAEPLAADIGSVSCPSREVKVTIRNTGSQREDYGVERSDNSPSVPGQIGPHETRTVTVRLREDRSTRILVNWANKRVESRTVRADCRGAGAAPPASPPTRLPHTGPDTMLWARAATGAAAMVTGVIIFWYGGVWPRRREQIFAKKGAE
ncbi:hypothetical protein [Actinomadura roseirufa]|uniref:hypothetical protein n=1 Tax=Actinomadura roseirufa TaxID=2094049 RepID=UPI0010410A80|nr:hypothetical protein [Actinomadura roseirufa]